ncbi:MAG: LamG-like jellyroll fold domain-containing protein [Planctomycetota bacterium]|jgi:hypothetical protein
MKQEDITSLLRKGMAVIICLLSVMAQQVNAASIEVAEELLVDLRSEDLAPGSVSEWPNRGSLGGVFTAFGNPVVEAVGDWENAVSLDGVSYFDGPVSPFGIVSSGTRSIEVWAYNVGESKEECMVAWSHRGGPDGSNMTFNYGWKDFGAAGHWGDDADMAWEGFDNATGGTGGYPPLEIWQYLAYTYDGSTIRLYVNGELNNERVAALRTHAGDIIRVGAQTNSDGSANLGEKTYSGAIAQVRIHDGVLTPAQIKNNSMIRVEFVGGASNPMPKNGDHEVIVRDLVLSWEPGLYPGTHTVYLSEDRDAVENGTAEVATDLIIASYDPGPLNYETTYYWRVDEVNAPPDKTVHEGKVWSFTTEPVSLAIANVTAAASSRAPEQGPASTVVDGSGLTDDLHSKDIQTMWSSSVGALQPTWIQCEFDRVHVLHEMWVWNSNTELETAIGYGFKDVVIECSVDGVNYTTLGTTHEFARAPGDDGYAHNTTIDFGGVQAKYVKLTANTNWAPFPFPQFGLSEVRFFYIPLHARLPQPESGRTDVDVDVTLGWRAGRQAAEHDVYVSADEQTVIDGTAPVTVTTQASHGPLSLDMSRTYYWRVDEINASETPTMLPGDIWSFTTQDYRVVDDFESYNDVPVGQEDSNLVYAKYKDGLDSPNVNGSTIGYFTGASMETGNVHGGELSVPLTYNNTVASLSEVTVDPGNLSIGRNWALGSAQTLVLWFHGSPDNAVTEQMYIKINGAKVVYPGSATDVTKPRWQQWNLDLAALGVNLSNVTQFTIGFERTAASGGKGTVLIDDVLLYRQAPEILAPAEEIWIEAEAANTITDPMKIYDDPLASDGKYIGTTDNVGDSSDSPPPDGIATYNFTVQGGIYKVAGRVIIPSGDSFWVRIPGAADLTPGEDPDNPGTGWVRWSDPPDGDYWHWDDVFSGDHDGQTANWTLPAGAYTLEIARREDGALLDVIVISKVD